MVYFSTWMTSVLLSINWSKNIPRGMIKHIFKLIQNRKLTRNMISCIFYLNCKANAANLKWIWFKFIPSIRQESVHPLACYIKEQSTEDYHAHKNKRWEFIRIMFYLSLKQLLIAFMIWYKPCHTKTGKGVKKLNIPLERFNLYAN